MGWEILIKHMSVNMFVSGIYTEILQFTKKDK